MLSPDMDARQCKCGVVCSNAEIASECARCVCAKYECDVAVFGAYPKPHEYTRNARRYMSQAHDLHSLSSIHKDSCPYVGIACYLRPGSARAGEAGDRGC